MKNKKPIICLVCDIPNWAFEMIAQKVKKDLSDTYNIRIDYYDMRKEPDNFFEFLEKNNDADLLHFFWRKSLMQIETNSFKEKVTSAGYNLNEYIEKNKKRISTCVYDYMFINEDEMEQFKNIFNKYSNHYYVCTNKLFQTYTNTKVIQNPETVIHDICDWDIYVPMNLERFNDEKRPLVIGWVGNSLANNNDVDLKGFHSIVKPVVKELFDEGYNIVEHYADRNIKWRTADEMPTYYSEIDVCICASTCEGTPRPVLESMSCGVPVISTDVGIVRDAFGKMQEHFIIGDRENGNNDFIIKENLKEKLDELYNNRHLLKELSDENLKSIIEYDGGKITQDFRNYFKKCLQ